MTKNELKYLVSSWFGDRVKVLRAREKEINLQRTNEYVEKKLLEYNIKVTADVDLSQIDTGDYSLNSFFDKLSTLQSCNKHLIFELFKDLAPDEYWEDLEIEKIEKLRDTILGNISNMKIKEAISYVEGIGINIGVQKQELLAPVDVNYIKELGGLTNDTKK